MLNITFAGNVFDSNEDQYVGNEVAYQALFYSPSSDYYKWNDIHLTELGKYNINLGDGDWLTQSGYTPSLNDKIIICFWVDNTKNRSDLDITKWSFIEIEHDGSYLYINDAQIKTPQNPLCLFDISGNVTINNNGTTNDNNWVFNNVDQYQEYERYNQILFPIMEFQDDSITVDWGDSNIEIFDFVDSMNHIYDEPGDYHISVMVENVSGLTCQSEFDVQSDAIINEGLTWTIPSYKNQPITFNPNITGDTLQIISVSYNINGDDIYTGLYYDESFQHTFTEPGPHTITQDIIVDNVYGTTHIIKDYTVYLDSIANFYKDDGTCGPIFIDNSIVGNGNITEHYWAIKYDGEIISEYTGDSSWEYTWPYIGIFTVLHKIKDSEGNQFGIERTYDIKKCPGSKEESGGGGGGGWTQTVYVEKEFPKLSVKKIDEIDERNININIKATILKR